MRFLNVHAQNFMSYEELNVSLEQGLCLIDGYNYDDNNSNGAGKTGICDAVCWSLFGDMPRNMGMEEVANRYKKGTCFVEVLLEHKGQRLLVYRSRNPVDLYMSLEGEKDEIIRGKDVRETQQLIVAKLGIDFSIFVNSIYFCQNARAQFVTATDNEKKDILTNLLNLEVFDQAYSAAHQCVKDTEELCAIHKRDVDYSAHEYAQLAVEIKHLQEQEESFQVTINSKIQALEQENERIAVFCKGLDTLFAKTQQELNGLVTTVQDWSQLEKQYSLLQHQISAMQLNQHAIKTQLKTIDSDIRQIQELGVGTCSQCHQPVTTEHIENEVSILKQKTVPLVTAYKQFQQRLEPSLERLKQLDVQLETRQQSEADESKRAFLTSELQHLIEQQAYKNDLIQRNKKSIAEVQNTPNNLKNIINEKDQAFKLIQQKQKQVQEQWMEAEETLNNYLTLKDVYSKIKYTIFQTVVQELNNNIEKYLSPLFDSDISITFATQTENKKGEIKQKFSTNILKSGLPCSFQSLSDGERRRIEIATNFALSDIVSNRSQQSFNIMFLDEILSAGLSKDGAEKVVELIRSMKNDKNIFIIDHNAFTKDLIDNSIFVEKRNNISKIVEK